jgi:hypothetical protein
MLITTGYHGTTKNRARKIIKNCFHHSKSGWLGKGIYFFEDYGNSSGMEEAKNWMIKVKKAKNYSIIKANINSKHYLDLAYDKEAYINFEKIKEEIIKKLKYERKKIDYDNLDTVVFSYIDREYDFEIIRALIDNRKINKRKKNSSYIIFFPQVQICVKKISCIIEKEIV